MANQPELFNVSKCATCKKCGSNTVFWCKSLRTGRFYLVDVTNGQTTRQTFHKCVPVAATPVKHSPKCAMCSQTINLDNGHVEQEQQGVMRFWCLPCVQIQADNQAEDKACNEAEISLTDDKMAAAVLADMGIEAQDPIDTLIANRKDDIIEALKAQFAASPDSIEITDTRSNTVTQSKVIPVTDNVVKALDQIAKKPEAHKAPWSTWKATDENGMVRNIPCPRCARPVSYQELIRKVPHGDCNHLNLP